MYDVVYLVGSQDLSTLIAPEDFLAPDPNDLLDPEDHEALANPEDPEVLVGPNWPKTSPH